MRKQNKNSNRVIFDLPCIVRAVRISYKYNLVQEEYSAVHLSSL